eukprot:236311_1
MDKSTLQLIVILVVMICGAVSFVGNSFIIVSYLCIKRIRSYLNRLIVYVSVVDNLYVLGALLIIPERKSNIMCQIGGGLLTTNCTSSLCDIFVVYNLYSYVCMKNADAQKYEKYFLVALIIKVICFDGILLHSLGIFEVVFPGYCWLNSRIYQVMYYELQIWISLLAVTIALTYVQQKLFKMANQQNIDNMMLYEYQKQTSYLRTFFLIFYVTELLQLIGRLIPYILIYAPIFGPIMAGLAFSQGTLNAFRFNSYNEIICYSSSINDNYNVMNVQQNVEENRDNVDEKQVEQNHHFQHQPQITWMQHILCLFGFVALAPVVSIVLLPIISIRKQIKFHSVVLINLMVIFCLFIGCAAFIALSNVLDIKSNLVILHFWMVKLAFMILIIFPVIIYGIKNNNAYVNAIPDI